MSKKRSAFAIYAETKPEDKLTESVKATKNNEKGLEASFKKGSNNQISLNDHKTKSGGITKKPNNIKQIKKEKNKFSKLSNENLSESITLFSNGHSINTKFPSKEFKVLTHHHNKNINKNQENKKNQSDQKKLKQKNIELKSSKTEMKKSKKQKLSSKKTKKNNKKSNQAFKSINFEDDEAEYEPDMFDSRQEAINLFKKVIAPVKAKDFFSNFWEKNTMLIKRNKSKYYNNWFSCEEFDWILRNHNLEFTTHIDIVTYINDVKQKHNPEGRAYAPLVWDFFQQGCSIRLLNPATYSRNVWKYLSVLQELFGCCVGANVYLTPAGTQGFAPHYDDIEAFVLQLEGKKRWRVYKPLNDGEVLPRFSSQNYKQSDLTEPPVIDVILEAGDLLYFPRGYIHQANACDDIHSLHITVSSYQKNSWGDFLLKLLPGAIEIAMQEDVEFRKGLPINYLINNGIAYEDKETNDRIKFNNKTANLVKNLVKYLPIDAAVDQMAKEFIHQSLPPYFTENEKTRSIHGHGERWNPDKNKVENISEIEPDTAIKLIRKNSLRLVVEDESCLIYHNLDNSKIYCEKEAQYLEVDSDAAPAIEFLINSYPNYVTVDELPMDSTEERISVAQCLYDKGLLVTGEPLNCDFEEDSVSEHDEETEISFSNDYFKNGEDEDDDDENNHEEIEENDEDENSFNSEDYDNFDGEENQNEPEEAESGSENEQEESD